jgi:DNA-binding Lrp family transcriptional regulator
MKRSDLLFLTLLRQDARQTLTAMSRKTNIPISTLYDKLKTHEKGVITRHTTLLDFAKLGYNCRAKIMLACTVQDKDKLRQYLKESGCINSLFKINNGFDFMAEGIFESVNALDSFIEGLEKLFTIVEKKVYYVIEDIRRENFLARPEQVSELHY